MYHLRIRNWMRFVILIKLQETAFPSICMVTLYPSYAHTCITQVVKMFDRSDHYCQPPPPGCPRAIYAVMVDCW